MILYKDKDATAVNT